MIVSIIAVIIVLGMEGTSVVGGPSSAGFGYRPYLAGLWANLTPWRAGIVSATPATVSIRSLGRRPRCKQEIFSRPALTLPHRSKGVASCPGYLLDDSLFSGRRRE